MLRMEKQAALQLIYSESDSFQIGYQGGIIMLSSKIKRCFSLFMAIFMLISLMPASALAAGEEDHDHSHESIEQAANNTNESAGPELPSAAVNPAIAEYQAEIDRILTEYFGGTELTAEEIQATVDAMDDFTFSNWLYFDVLLVDEYIMEAFNEGVLSEAEVTYIVDSNPVFVTVAEIVYAKAAQMEFDAGLYTEVEVLDGQVTITDSANTGAGDANSYSAYAQGTGLSRKSNTITVSNTSGSRSELSLSYNVTNSGGFTIDGTSSSTSGSHKKVLNPGESVVFEITSASAWTSSGRKVTLTLTNVTLTAVAASSDVTFVYDSSLGSVTVGDSAVANGGIVNISGTDGAKLVATPASGSTFLGWTDVEGNLLYSAATYTYTPASNTTVKALFANEKGNAVFTVGTNYFDDLNAAATFASSATSKTIVVVSNGIVPAGNYTIPTGVTLQIPFDASNTMYKDEPASDSSLANNGTYVKPTVFRKLTLASNAHITVNGTGAINLSAKMHAAGGGKTNAGAPTGPCSFMHMNSGSSITLNDTSKLYAWGFITGQGNITANSGTTVYEFFQFEDFRGGSQTLDETMKTNRVFPLSQYYVQNIEASLTVKAGASVICRTNVYMSYMSIAFNVDFIGGDSAMFALSSGFVTKRYDPATDRLILDGTGTFACSSTSLEISGSSIDSADYILPLNSNISLYIRDGSAATISQDILLQPGTEIVVEEGAEVTLAEGTEIYAFDADQWQGYCYSNSKNVKLVALPYAPGRTYTRTESDLKDAKILVNGEIDASAGGIYTTAGGANVYTDGTGKITYKDGTGASVYQLKQSGSTYDEIDVTAAQLKNGDGTYTDTSTAAAGSTFEYCTKHDVWYTGECEKCANATGHTYSDEWAWNADGTYTLTLTCNHCEAGTEGHEVIQNGTGTETEKTAATCVDDGFVKYTASVTEGTQTFTSTSDAFTLTATGHTFGETVPYKAATCLAPGNEAYKQCSTCGKYFAADAGENSTDAKDSVDAFTIEQLDHVYTGDIKSDGNGEDATHSRLCVNGCNQYGGAVAHTWGEGEETKAPTCTDEGILTYTCTVDGCGATYTEAIQSKGHTPGDDTENNIVSATADKDSYTVVTACEVCGEPADTKKVNTVAFVNIDIDGEAKSVLFGSLADALAYAAEKEIGVVMLQRNVTEPVTVSQTVAVYDNGVTVNGENLVAGNDYTKARRVNIDGKADAWIFYPKVEYITYTSSLLTVEGKVSLLMKFYIPTELKDDVIINTLRESCTDTVRNKSIEYSPTNSTVGALRASGMDDKGRYTLIQEFASGEMSSNVSVYFKDGDTELPIYANGKEVADTFKCSIADYSVEALKNGSDKMRYLSQTMLTFGNYAKKYFGVEYSPNTGKADLDSIVSDAVSKGYVTALNLDAFSAVWDAENNSYKASVSDTFAEAPIETTTIRQSLILDSDTTIRVFFNAADDVDLSDYTFTLFYPANNTTSQMAVKPERQSDGRYMIAIESIPVAYWDSECKILVTRKGETAEVPTEKLEISIYVLTWAKNCINSQSATEEQKNMAKAMFLYNDAANKYFAR